MITTKSSDNYFVATDYVMTIEPGRYFQMFSANGRSKGTFKAVGFFNSTSIVYRPARWNERLWLWLKRTWKEISYGLELQQKGFFK